MRAGPRDAGAVTTHQVTYQGPPAFAVRAATLLAAADGVELTSANPPEVLEGSQIASLVVTVEGTAEAVAAAVASLQLELPPDAAISIDGR